MEPHSWRRTVGHLPRFGEFDPAVMAVAITGAIDAMVTSRASDTGSSLARSAKELADLFMRATGAGDVSPGRTS